MKKVLSVISVVALLMSLCAGMLVPAVAASINDPYNLIVMPQRDGEAEVAYDKEQGVVTIEALAPHDETTDAASGAIFDTWLQGADLTQQPYLHVALSTAVPFRLYIRDRDADSDNWISGIDFYMELVPDGCTDPVMPENGFYPTGDYDCVINLKSLYEWHASFDGWDPTAANISQVYLQLKDKGSMTVTHLALSSSAVCACELPLEEEQPKLGELQYALHEDGTAQVVGYDGVDNTVVIPPTVDGHTVTSIADDVFSRVVYNIGLIIPETVTEIGKNVLSKIWFIGYGGTEEEWKTITIGEQTGNWYQKPRYYHCCGAFQEGEFYYLVNTDGTATVRDHTGTSGITSAVIPDQANGYPVTAIGQEVFYQHGSLKSVTLPSTLVSIGNQAFAYCTSLESITFPQGLTTLGMRAFAGCEKLTTLNIPDGVTEIGSGAFLSCERLTELTLPASLTEIGSEAFESCRLLASVTLPDGLKVIGGAAFYSCSALKSIRIPASVETIYGGVFASCHALETITVDPDNAHYCTRDGILYSKDMTQLVQFPLASTVSTVEIPDGVTTVMSGAFYGQHHLYGLTIPDSVTCIEYGAILDPGTSLTVYAPYFSAADMYTYENDIGFEPTGISTKADGDVNTDGKVTIADAVQLYYHVNGKVTLWGSALAHGNVSEPSALVTIADAVVIYYFVNGRLV